MYTIELPIRICGSALVGGKPWFIETWGNAIPKKEDMFVFSAKPLRHVQTSETFYRFTK